MQYKLFTERHNENIITSNLKNNNNFSELMQNYYFFLNDYV